jgi:hypothetical protein
MLKTDAKMPIKVTVHAAHTSCRLRDRSVEEFLEGSGCDGS